VREVPDGTIAEARARPVRVGVVNIMPRAETYEADVLRPLALAPLAVDPVWIRLRTHRYASSDGARIRTAYVDFADAVRPGPLDALIVTGAPVEELDFHAVHYWNELSGILQWSREHVPRTLGLCWGGLALAKLLGIEKERLARKLFGAFSHANLAPSHPLLEGSGDAFCCAHSRHSGTLEPAVDAAQSAGTVRVLARGAESGTTIFESSDRRFVGHLGHPEYGAGRLVEEWNRDRALGRGDVGPPHGFDVDRPARLWASHCDAFFSAWVLDVAAARRP
jgi:homoserine O-succinyltransferase